MLRWIFFSPLMLLFPAFRGKMETVQELEVIAIGENVQNVNTQTDNDDCFISAENEKLIA